MRHHPRLLSVFGGVLDGLKHNMAMCHASQEDYTNGIAPHFINKIFLISPSSPFPVPNQLVSGMHPSHAQLALLASFIGLSLAATSSKNCSDNKDGTTLSCYTCMGRDLENCEYGQVCCKGSCYKLVDEDHQLIVKGCTNDNEEDASMKRRTLDVALYWTNQEKVTGESYFCSGKNFCNSGTAVSVLSSVAALLILTLLR